ncbi:SDR family NAD(P)-dependent oxidoreductase [Microvirga puerhi]|uniref:SDR family oxidoreductase n=1 Tax=Microvirga puerhi TaxID=2876078 RepID=A0ABS7VTK6_9HYPH|nr:SDR family oxidoreductase [Microvirga puerhi]MBZ6078481.1 SDR family oxidoreductase [Microvirga puerhi]
MRTTILTGCGGGMGRAICAEMKNAGDRVVGLDKPGTESGIEHERPDRFIPCDLSDIDDTRRALDDLAEEVGIGCLVNCAGLYEKKTVFELTLEDFDRVLTVNLRAPFLLSQQLAKRMADDGGGVIVNIASINGKLGSPIIPYGTSKAGLIGLTRSLAKTLAPYNIRVNAIAPGTIRTPMAASVDSIQMERQMYSVAMGRVGEPREIATVVRFLASADSTYMTGSIVDVAGGWIS